MVIKLSHRVLNHSKPTKSVPLVIGTLPLSYALSSTNIWVQDNVHLSVLDTQEHAELDKGELPFPLGAK